jgi:hypothetical protein
VLVEQVRPCRPMIPVPGNLGWLERYRAVLTPVKGALCEAAVAWPEPPSWRGHRRVMASRRRVRRWGYAVAVTGMLAERSAALLHMRDR